jgi:hypothetical protein
MARIVLGSYMVRYPLGGMISYVLQWLVGFQQLGHDIYFVEKAHCENACFDPSRGLMSNDSSFGVSTVRSVLSRFGLEDRFCFVDALGIYHGLERSQIEKIFATSDVFFDMGTHGAWLPEAANTGRRVLIDGEPGFTQIKIEKTRSSGVPLPQYDHYFSHGANIGTNASLAPKGGLNWDHVYSPVLIDEFPYQPLDSNAALTTVMNWQSHDPIEFDGITYGQKDVEFENFLDLPIRTSARLEVAISGRVPKKKLIAKGWHIADAQTITRSYDSFQRYVRASLGEFSVCKNIFVAMHTGWFSDRSAAYLASGRPVVLQDTGFSTHLPCGIGLHAVNDVEEAAAAIDCVLCNGKANADAAREIAHEYFDTRKVLPRLLGSVGCVSPKCEPGINRSGGTPILE